MRKITPNKRGWVVSGLTSPGHATGQVYRPNRQSAGYMATLDRHKLRGPPLYDWKTNKSRLLLTLATRGTLDDLAGGARRVKAYKFRKHQHRKATT